MHEEDQPARAELNAVGLKVSPTMTYVTNLFCHPFKLGSKAVFFVVIICTSHARHHTPEQGIGKPVFT